MSSFQGREFNKPNLIAPDKRGVKKGLPFHVNKNIGYSIIPINRVSISLYLVSHVFIIVIYNINFALNNKKRGINIELFELFGSPAFNSEFSKATSCQIGYAALLSSCLFASYLNGNYYSIASFSLTQIEFNNVRIAYLISYTILTTIQFHLIPGTTYLS